MSAFMKTGYNYALTAGVLSWVAAQVIKTLLHFILTKKFRFERLLGSGGMPSSHSALVCASTMAICRQCGKDSAEFAVMSLVALIVMYDAMGVRRAAGLHAREINRMKKIFEIKEITQGTESSKKIKDLKEYLGHTPFEVLSGALLGIIIALVLPFD